MIDEIDKFMFIFFLLLCIFAMGYVGYELFHTTNNVYEMPNGDVCLNRGYSYNSYINCRSGNSYVNVINVKVIPAEKIIGMNGFCR